MVQPAELPCECAAGHPLWIHVDFEGQAFFDPAKIKNPERPGQYANCPFCVAEGGRVAQDYSRRWAPRLLWPPAGSVGHAISR